MSWSSSFLTNLKYNQSLTFMFRLEFRDLFAGPSEYYVIDANNKDFQFENDSIRINGTQIQPQTFNVTFGQFSLNLVGDYRVLSNKISRGAVAILSVGLARTNPVNYQRLIWGQLQTIRKVNYQTFELVFDDALSILNNRLDLDYNSSLGVHQSGLYYNLLQSTNPTTNFNVNTDTDLYVDNINIFEKDTNTNGLIKIEEEHASDGLPIVTGKH